jgi:hypothetical protein
MSEAIAGMWEYGQGRRQNVGLYCRNKYSYGMREFDTAATNLLQHTSADVAPELFGLAAEVSDR